MQLFYAPELDPDAGSYVFSEEESKHCVLGREIRCT